MILETRMIKKSWQLAVGSYQPKKKTKKPR
jgi:hypothetical protein